MKTELVLPEQEESSKAACQETDSSLHKSDCQKQPQPVHSKPLKKRIGPFSFYLNDVIGRGFSSVVYKGVRDNDKAQAVALKVVGLEGMSPHRRLLLDNQVHILKMVQHPHIVALLDVYYTPHNCYIVMEYCEGGSLQARIDAKFPFHWPTAAEHIASASQYLSEKNIMHRDIKPANVFIKGDQYKLGDFGFSHQLADNEQHLQEKYLIGSPIYMAPEALTKNIYSPKGDAFAYGVFLYYLATHHFPWKGKDKQELIQQYQHKTACQKHLHSLPPKFKYFLNGLLEREAEKRLKVGDLDLTLFRRVRKMVNVEEEILHIGRCYQHQIKICQFIHFLMINFQRWQQTNVFLLPMISKHLGQLVQVFGWHRHPYMQHLTRNYLLPIGQFQFNNDQYHWLNNCLKDTLSTLVSSIPEPYSQGIVLKLVQYQCLVEGIMYGLTQENSFLVESLTLHQSFELVRGRTEEVKALVEGVDFYQL